MEEKQKNGVDNDVVKLTYREYIRILKTMKDDQRAKLNGWNVAR
ncbi:hypothetical protein AWB76_00918 [Caballeronia temeraria]|uniref:Uncharacterized protein n=1 Tax=Caballeronia temeraria TaxID=1777137 RepID=A0A157ZLS7_9BURK|nr:hypothetical protein AWB76_00918 [Caballeronia temeraria]